MTYWSFLKDCISQPLSLPATPMMRLAILLRKALILKNIWWKYWIPVATYFGSRINWTNMALRSKSGMVITMTYSCPREHIFGKPGGYSKMAQDGKANPLIPVHLKPMVLLPLSNNFDFVSCLLPCGIKASF